jgi:hypothetical protein
MKTDPFLLIGRVIGEISWESVRIAEALCGMRKAARNATPAVFPNAKEQGI